MQDENDLKIVLNVRNPKLVALLEQVKESTGINYQNTIKFGLLLKFQDEINKIKQFHADEAREAMQNTEKVRAKAEEEMIEKPVAAGLKPQVQEDSSKLLKVHITFVGQLKNALEVWKYRTGQSYQDIARQGLDKIFSFFNKENLQQQISDSEEIKKESKKENLLEFIDKKKTLLDYLNA